MTMFDCEGICERSHNGLKDWCVEHKNTEGFAKKTLTFVEDEALLEKMEKEICRLLNNDHEKVSQ